MKWIFIHALNQGEIAEIPEPFSGTKGDYVVYDDISYIVDFIEYDYDAKIVRVSLDVVS